MSSAEFQPLTIEVDRSQGGPLLRAKGEIDTVTAPHLQKNLDLELAEPGLVLIVDLTGVTFLSSAGLSALVAAHQRADETGGQVRIVTAERVARVFHLTGLGETLRLYETVDQARSSS